MELKHDIHAYTWLGHPFHAGQQCKGLDRLWGYCGFVAGDVLLRFLEPSPALQQSCPLGYLTALAFARNFLLVDERYSTMFALWEAFRNTVPQWTALLRPPERHLTVGAEDDERRTRTDEEDSEDEDVSYESALVPRVGVDATRALDAEDESRYDDVLAWGGAAEDEVRARARADFSLHWPVFGVLALLQSTVRLQEDFVSACDQKDSPELAGLAEELKYRIENRLTFGELPARILAMTGADGGPQDVEDPGEGDHKFCPLAKATAYAALAWAGGGGRGEMMSLGERLKYVTLAQTAVESWQSPFYLAYDVLASRWPVFALLQRFHEDYSEMDAAHGRSDVEVPPLCQQGAADGNAKTCPSWVTAVFSKNSVGEDRVELELDTAPLEQDGDELHNVFAAKIKHIQELERLGFHFGERGGSLSGEEEGLVLPERPQAFRAALLTARDSQLLARDDDNLRNLLTREVAKNLALPSASYYATDVDIVPLIRTAPDRYRLLRFGMNHGHAYHDPAMVDFPVDMIYQDLRKTLKSFFGIGVHHQPSDPLSTIRGRSHSVFDEIDLNFVYVSNAEDNLVELERVIKPPPDVVSEGLHRVLSLCHFRF